MPCEVDNLEVGELIVLVLEDGAMCSGCEYLVEPIGAEVKAQYMGYNTKGQHYFIGQEKVCPKCGETTRDIVFSCGNTARELFSLIGYQEPEESTEAESLVVIEVPRRSTYTPPKNIISLWS